VHAGQGYRFLVPEAEKPERRLGHDVGDELRPLRTGDVVVTSHRPTFPMMGAISRMRGVSDSVEFAHGEPCPLVRRVSLDLPGVKSSACSSTTQTRRNGHGDDRAIASSFNPVLQSHQNAVLLEVGLINSVNQRVSFDLAARKHDVEIPIKRRQIA